MEDKSSNEFRVATVILNYNTWDETIDCIISILETYQNMSIFIVDNCSNEPQTDKFRNYMNANRNIYLINADLNGGYSAGNNLGINKVINLGFDYIFISNSDIIVVGDTVNKMISLCEDTPNCAIVGPQIYNKDGVFLPFLMRCKLDFYGKLKNMGLKIPIVKWFLNGFKKSFIIDSEISKPEKVFGVHGSFFLMTKECAEFLYPLDERSFLYEEEYIIGCQIENTKYSAYICPDTKVIHLEGVSTKGMSPFAFKCMTDSEQLYMQKYLCCKGYQCAFLYFVRHIQFVLKSFVDSRYRKFLLSYLKQTKDYKKKL